VSDREDQAPEEQASPEPAPSTGAPEPTSEPAAQTSWETTPPGATEPTTPYPSAFGHTGWPPQDPPAHDPLAQGPTRDDTDRPRLPGWTWPLISAVALLLGLAGGAIGGALVAGGDNGSGGVLKVERRTAPPLDTDNTSIAAVSAKVLPSTVQIIAEYAGKPQGATGSGFVFDKQGHVITNNHVVAQAADDDGPIEIIDQNGDEYAAKVVGRSPTYDLAVLYVKGGPSLPPASLGSAQVLRVGDQVVAFGSPLGLSSTVTSGIVSALNRPVTTSDTGSSSYINAVQTDAAINPGNSGGPLVDLTGRVVGVNSAIATTGGSTGPSGSIGVGFAIPIDQVKITADQILRTGEARYPVIGATVDTSESSEVGAKILKVNSGGPAERGGLRKGDLVTDVAGEKVPDGIALIVAIRAHQPGDTVPFTVRRGSSEMRLAITLGSQVG
jgi:putative serine protease PepD